ncbi:MAG: hypothetical protein ABSH32_04875 [Bryobacteraceae bacterium]
MPFYNPEDETYYARAHRNGRDPDQQFDPAERLFRRYPEASLVEGKPVPLAMQFDSGVSVNRAKFSEPQDVLEPDYCEGRHRPGHVVLVLRVFTVPDAIGTEDRSGRVFQFRLKHTPRETCYPHSEAWCNQSGDIYQDYEKPPKQVRDKLRVALARHLGTENVLRFESYE